MPLVVGRASQCQVTAGGMGGEASFVQSRHQQGTVPERVAVRRLELNETG